LALFIQFSLQHGNLRYYVCLLYISLGYSSATPGQGLAIHNSHTSSGFSQATHKFSHPLPPFSTSGIFSYIP
jgi:hypothetical protein